MIAFMVRTFIPSIPAIVSPLWVTLGVAMSVGVGLFFGYYPPIALLIWIPSSASGTNDPQNERMETTHHV